MYGYDAGIVGTIQSDRPLGTGYGYGNTSGPRPVPPAAPRPQDVTVAVLCHNYARFLPACLRSVFAQTVAPLRIVVYDDASTDNTPAVAQRWQKQPALEYQRLEFADLGAVRNHVLADCRTPWLLFVDADNRLAPRYLEHLLREAQADKSPALALVYPSVHFFGGSEERHPALPFDAARLRLRNYIDSGSLLRVSAARSVGGWEAAPTGPAEDWGLNLRLAADGWTARPAPRAILHYRIHGANRGMSAEGQGDDRCLLRNARFTLLTLFCGRAWQLDRYFKWLERMQCSPDRVTLYALDNSGDVAFGRQLRRRLARQTRFACVRYERAQSRCDPAADQSNALFAEGGQATRAPRDAAIHTHLGYLYGHAFAQAAPVSDFVFCVEDDVIPPGDALPRLLKEMTGWDNNVGAAGLPVLSRQNGRVMAWRGHVAAACCLYRAEALQSVRPRFEPWPTPLYWDVSVTRDMAAAPSPAGGAGWQVRWNATAIGGDAAPRHYEPDGTFVQAAVPVPVSRKCPNDNGPAAYDPPMTAPFVPLAGLAADVAAGILSREDAASILNQVAAGSNPALAGNNRI